MPTRPLDADRRRLAERDVEAEVARQRRLDDLLLDLAVERDRELLADVVLPDVDQRVLLGELGERDAEPRSVVGISPATTTDSSVGGGNWCARSGPGLADPVADLDLVETPELRDRARGDRRTLHGRPALEDRDRRDLVLGPGPNRTRSRVRIVPENIRT